MRKLFYILTPMILLSCKNSASSTKDIQPTKSTQEQKTCVSLQELKQETINADYQVAMLEQSSSETTISNERVAASADQPQVEDDALALSDNGLETEEDIRKKIAELKQKLSQIENKQGPQPSNSPTNEYWENYMRTLYGVKKLDQEVVCSDMKQNPGYQGGYECTVIFGCVVGHYVYSEIIRDSATCQYEGAEKRMVETLQNYACQRGILSASCDKVQNYGEDEKGVYYGVLKKGERAFSCQKIDKPTNAAQCSDVTREATAGLRQIPYKKRESKCPVEYYETGDVSPER